MTHGIVAHGSHDAVGAAVEGALDHPGLVRGDADNGADLLSGNVLAELLCQLQSSPALTS